MDLVREVLDSRVLDRAGQPIGRVDGIVLRLRDGEPPVVTDLALGGLTAVNRLRRPFRGVVAWIVTRWGLRAGRAYRIPWSRVHDVGIDVTVGVDERETPAHAWERRIGRSIVRRLGG
ncbi:MAG TPA: hypothetical protein VFQ38_01425 [Longimicrobiales bacterium]|nr:hypothetical protein [Longimicrobiales bacterium]